MTKKQIVMRWLALPGLLLACLGATSIDSVLKYSWAENVGWLNWRDANAGAQGVAYHGTHLSGFIWGENVGYVNVGGGSGPYANTNDTNFGVNVLGGGNLSGYAWAENLGWVNFDTAPQLAAFSQQARYDAGAGRFRGYAWSENVGWLNLDDPTKYVAVSTGVSITQWRSVRTHSSVGPLNIVLNPTGTGNGTSGPTVETRSGGIRRIEAAFSGPIALNSPAGVTVVGRANLAGVMGPPVAYTPSSVSVSGGSTLTIDFAASPAPGFLPDQTCYTIVIGPTTLAQSIIGDNDVSVRALVADTTGNGDVALGDTLATKARVTTPTTAVSAPHHDVNLTGGNINLGDTLFVKSQVTSPPHRAFCP